MPAGVHPAGHGRREFEPGLFRHRKCVHVAAKQHASPLLAGVEHRDRARARRAFAPFERQIGKLGLHLGERFGSVEPELGLGVDRAAKRGDAPGDSVRILEQVFGQHGGGYSRTAALNRA